MARALSTIANEISNDWKKVNYGAVPYLQAMAECETIHSRFGCEDGRMQVLYFLANAQSWKGETARRVKAELKGMLHSK